MKTELTPEEKKEFLDAVSRQPMREIYNAYRKAGCTSFYSCIRQRGKKFYGLLFYHATDNFQSLEADLVDAIQANEKFMQDRKKPITKRTFTKRANELVKEAGQKLHISSMLRENEEGTVATFEKFGEIYSVILKKDGGKLARQQAKELKTNKTK